MMAATLFPAVGDAAILSARRRAVFDTIARMSLATSGRYASLAHAALGREAKYKSKNFIDTVVFRGGDAASGWIYAGLKGLGLSLSGLAAAAIPGAILWLALGLLLGRQHTSLAATPDPRTPSQS
jgi:ATP:ADP antiporter, AAA family